MLTERRVVDNRVFLSGLDKLYRDAMKQHEREELLKCARRVSAALDVKPAAVPVEGYYAEDKRLSEYFLLIRALQAVDESAASLVDSLPEFQRLRDVTSAPLYGHSQYNGKLLPAGCDALSLALLGTYPEWTVATLTAAAYSAARDTDDISLVGLAARIHDTVVLTAVRESVVLYADILLSRAPDPPRPKYVWKVDQDLSEHAMRFIETFNELFGDELPPPHPSQAKCYWHAYDENEILGRCVRLGYDDTTSPIQHYHWAICRATSGVFVVKEFWNSEVWSTTRFRSEFHSEGFPEL